MESSPLKEIDKKILSLRSLVETTNRDIETLERAKTILNGKGDAAELPFPKTDELKSPSPTKASPTGPTKFLYDKLQEDPHRSWTPGELAIEYGKNSGLPDTAEVKQDHRLAIHGALRPLVAKGFVTKSEPDSAKVRRYKWKI